MKIVHAIGEVKSYTILVKQADIASFESGVVHPVYATFALGRDAEWACRLFVLEMKEMHEEGIGTYLNIKHQSPALVGQTVLFQATLESIEKNNIHCSFVAKVGTRIIATGTQGQKIVAKDKLSQLFESLNQTKA
jgi:predicted thioesterase